jgi:hypothetical protein
MTATDVDTLTERLETAISEGRLLLKDLKAESKLLADQHNRLTQEFKAVEADYAVVMEELTAGMVHAATEQRERNNETVDRLKDNLKANLTELVKTYRERIEEFLSQDSIIEVMEDTVRKKMTELVTKWETEALRNSAPGRRKRR